jgi:hypothetical protein
MEEYAFQCPFPCPSREYEPERREVMGGRSFEQRKCEPSLKPERFDRGHAYDRDEDEDQLGKI